MNYLYATADAIGTETGGGSVTKHESEEIAALGETTTILSYPDAPRPWGADEAASYWLQTHTSLRPKLAHFYSGTFTKTIEILKERGCKVTYTAAAHDINVSREEHEKLGLPFDYPHLNEPELWVRYVRGYLLADVVVCPSTLSKKCMESYGCKNVVVIPHGVDLPAKIAPLPKRFAVAYLGQPGPDKGLIYLLQAWKMLDYTDAVLTIAGRGTEHLLGMVRAFGGGNIYLRGWIEDPSEIYDGCSVYVQPSASEGFGLEVLEAMAHGRPVICSDGAGAADVAYRVVSARNPQALADAIAAVRQVSVPPDTVSDYMKNMARQRAERHTWPIIRECYADLWRSL